jgi:hypothetical protein
MRSKIAAVVFVLALLATGFVVGDIQYYPAQGGGTWGSITGTLGDQTDLQTAVHRKL